jgi:hypothetical protein
MIRTILCAAAAVIALTTPCAQADDDIVWLQGNGQVSFWKLEQGKRVGGGDIRTPIGPDWRLAAVGDIDGDRAADMIWEQINGQVAYWSKTAPQRTITNSIDRHPGPGWRLAGAGDVNGEGTSDLIWLKDDGQVDYWSMRRGERKERFIMGRGGPDWRFVGVGDVDGSGTADVVWRRDSGAILYWRIRDGQPIETLPITGPADPAWTLVGVGDVNGDAFADLIWRKADGRLHYWALYDGQRMGGYDLDASASPEWRFAGVGDVDRAPHVAPAIAPHPSSYAVPVEPLSLTRANGRFMETAFAVGGFTYASSISTVDQIGPATIDPEAPWRLKKHAIVAYRFSGPGGAILNAGKCNLRYKMWSAFFNRANSLYSCEPEEAYGQSALEVVLPPFMPPTDAMISVTVEDSDVHDNRYNALRASMRYGGVEYEALPFGIDPKREGTGRRVASGYTIAQAGRLVGRIDFPAPRGMVMSFGDGLDRQSTITAPVNDADGRQAVIFFAAQLLKTPEVGAQ